MRYRVMEAEKKKKPGSVLRQNKGIIAPARHNSLSSLQKNLLAAQAGLGNRYVQRMVARIKEGQESKETQLPQPSLENTQGGGRENHTGLPDQLKLGIEGLSGYSLDDVRVHYNSSKPAELRALAYTQGRQIYVAPGQERHLPHEAWHVVQQMQGRAKATSQLNSGVLVNDEEKMEQEADAMGLRAISVPAQPQSERLQSANPEREELLQAICAGAIPLFQMRSAGKLQEAEAKKAEIKITDGIGNVTEDDRKAARAALERAKASVIARVTETTRTVDQPHGANMEELKTRWANDEVYRRERGYVDPGHLERTAAVEGIYIERRAQAIAESRAREERNRNTTIQKEVAQL